MSSIRGNISPPEHPGKPHPEDQMTEPPEEQSSEHETRDWWLQPPFGCSRHASIGFSLDGNAHNHY